MKLQSSNGRKTMPVAAWHSTDTTLPPIRLAVRELMLLAIWINEYLAYDDVDLEQTLELRKVAKQIQRIAKRFHNVYKDDFGKFGKVRKRAK